MNTQNPFASIGMTRRVKQLMIINGVIYILSTLAIQWMGASQLANFFFLVPERVQSGWIWQLFTYMFFHSPHDPMHIVFNMLMLWMFGVQFERRWGSRRFLKFYFVCGISGGVLTQAWAMFIDADMMGIPTVGASGAIMGFIVAFGIIFAKQKIYMMGIIPMTGRQLLFLSIGIEFLFMLTKAQVSYTAHGGGMIAAWLLVTDLWRPSHLLNKLKLSAIERNRKQKRSQIKLVKDDNDKTLH